MEPIEIGLWTSAGLLVMVLLGMRVAFAAAMAGLVGLIWIFSRGYLKELVEMFRGKIAKT